MLDPGPMSQSRNGRNDDTGSMYATQPLFTECFFVFRYDIEALTPWSLRRTGNAAQLVTRREEPWE